METEFTEIGRIVAARYNEFAEAFAFKDDSREWVRPLIARFAAGVRSGGLVLDLGCAAGRETVDLNSAGMNVVGLDLAAAQLQIAIRARPSYAYVQGDMTRLPFSSGSFDGVWASASLLHLPASVVPDALSEVSRVLLPGAGFFSSMQVGEAKDWVHPTEDQAVKADLFYAYYKPSEWRERVEAAGFEVVSFQVTDNVASCNVGAVGWIEVMSTKRREWAS